MRPSRRFTVYDMMEDKGLFESNPANLHSRDSTGLPLYKGPVEFPKMLYHPVGETKVSKPAEAINTPFGPKWVGEERQLINKTVETKEEEEILLKEGWHFSPGAATRAGQKARGEKVDLEVLNPLEKERALKEDETAKLRREIEELTAKNAELELGLKPKTVKAPA